MMKSSRRIWFTLGVLILISVPASLPLLFPGFYEPHDLHHLADIYQMFRAMASGQLPPRLGPDFSFGYGYPLYNFYYLLPFYLGAAWYWLIGSLTASFKFVFLISIFLSVFGMYLFLREFVKKFPALVGSFLFLYTPYRAVQIYVRGAMGEAFALSLLPFVLWGIVRLIKNPVNKKIVAGVSVITALFIISHNYLWAITLPFIVLLILLLNKHVSKKSVTSLLVSGLLSIGLTAFWWLPAIVENKLVSSVTPFPLIDHFPFIKQLIIPSWGYGSSVWGPGDEISFQIGVVNLAVVGFIVGFGVYKVKRHPELTSGSPLRKIPKLVRNKKITLLAFWALGGFVISVVMMNIRTLFIWRLIPFHDFIQFPWRLLIFTTIFTSVLAAVIIHILPKKAAKYVGMTIIAASFILTAQYFQPSKIVFKSDEEYLARFFTSNTYSEDYLLLPKWVSGRPPNPPVSKFEAEGAKIRDVEEKSSVRYRAEIETSEPVTLTFHSYYFPGWQAKIDGQQTEIKPGKPYGQIELEIPAGNHSVEFFWSETPLRKFSDYLSLLSIAILIGIVYPRVNRNA